jgi:hypothetical protein
VALALAALWMRYLLLPVRPLEELSAAAAQQVGVLYAVYAGGKLLFLFCLLAGTWLFVRREPLPRIGVGSGLAFIAGVGVLFLLAPSDLNPLVAWQAGITVPAFLICGALVAGMPRERRTRGSRMLAAVCFLTAVLWLLYTPAFIEAGPDNQPGRLILLRWIAGHNSYFDMLFEFLLGFGMILAVLDDVFHEAEEARISRLRDVPPKRGSPRSSARPRRASCCWTGTGESSTPTRPQSPRWAPPSATCWASRSTAS